MIIKTHVVIGRFQGPELTAGQKSVIDAAEQDADILVIIIGESPTRVANLHPLSFEIRRGMIAKAYPHAQIHKLNDVGDDKIWSKKLDTILEKYMNITLFGGRDSFIPKYFGKYATHEVPSVSEISATQVRNSLKDYNDDMNDVSFRRGVIHAIENKFPTVYPTVDIGVVKYNLDTPSEILLGRKYNSEIWCLMGGFVDPADESYEAAAYRELHEEVSHIETHELKYVGSFKINDWRYRGTTDSITTTLFITYFMGGNPKGNDDLEEVKFFTLEEAETAIGDHHKHLFLKIKDTFNESLKKARLKLA